MKRSLVAKWWMIVAGILVSNSIQICDLTAGEDGRKEWIGSDGVVYRDAGSKKWEETHSGSVRNRFVENGRSPDFVELYDASREYTLRLYRDALLIRGGRQPPIFKEYTRLTTGSWRGQATGAAIVDLRGNYRGGVYQADRERIIYFFAMFPGEFTAANANRTAEQAVAQLKKQNKTLDLGGDWFRQDVRTATDKHLVIGWHNVDRGQTGWAAASTRGNWNRYVYVTHDSSDLKSADVWTKFSQHSGGYYLHYSIADDDRGNMAMCISLPQ